MNKKQIEGQLKLSKKQNEDERSDYLCSQFNCVDYLIKLEKYTNNLLRKNKKQQEVIEEIRDYVTKIRDDYTNRSLEEKNLWIYEAYIHGVSNLVEILFIIDKVGG